MGYMLFLAAPKISRVQAILRAVKDDVIVIDVKILRRDHDG